MTNLKYWHENINMEFIGNIELYIDKDHSCLRIYDIHIRYFPQQEILVNSENTTLEWHSIRNTIFGYNYFIISWYKHKKYYTDIGIITEEECGRSAGT